MLCRNCNTENKSTSKFCYSCGEILNDVVDISIEMRSSPTEKPPKVIRNPVPNRNRNLIYIGLGAAIVIVIVVLYIFLKSPKKDLDETTERFVVISYELYKNVETPTIPATIGDKFANFNFMNLVETYFDNSFQDNSPSALKSAGISSSEIYECKISNGVVTEPEIGRKFIEYYDGDGKLSKKRIFLTPEEISYSMGDETYFDQEFKYYSNGLLSEKGTPSVNGSDGHLYRYFYNKNNTLSGFELLYNEVTEVTELRYNNNGVMKWAYKYSKLMGDESGRTQEYWTEFLYDDKGRVKRIFPINENKKPLEGYGHDIQYAESGVAVKSGKTINKKLVDGSTVFYSTKRTYDSRGLIISVRKYENNELKTLLLYNYGTEVKK